MQSLKVCMAVRTFSPLFEVFASLKCRPFLPTQFRKKVIEVAVFPRIIVSVFAESSIPNDIDQDLKTVVRRPWKRGCLVLRDSSGGSRY